MIYTIVGTPISVIKTSHYARKVIDEHNLARFNQRQQLQEQHEDKPFLRGVWELSVNFFFDKDYGKTKGLAPHKPPISSLLRCLDDLAQGIIYENECILYNVYVKKYYNSPESKIVMQFSRLKE